MPGKTGVNCYIDHEDNRERYRSGRNGVDSKSICPVNSGARGFESHPLRQNLNVILLNPPEADEG